jgi:hypothetical protein
MHWRANHCASCLALCRASTSFLPNTLQSKTWMAGTTLAAGATAARLAMTKREEAV